MISCVCKNKLYILKKLYILFYKFISLILYVCILYYVCVCVLLTNKVIVYCINYHSIAHYIFIVDSHVNMWIISRYVVSPTHFSRDAF